VTEHPILFSAPMARAILDGRKTQTRRVIKLPPAPNSLGQWEPFWFGGEGCRDSRGNEISGHWTISHTRTGAVIGCPLGVVGDRLWVRETWADLTETHGQPWEKYNHNTGLYERGRTRFVWYRADGEQPGVGDCVSTVEPWRPSIFMRRSDSRITLEITDVRVQRLQDISGDDASSEGVQVPISDDGRPLLELTGKFPASRYVDDESKEWFRIGGRRCGKTAALHNQLSRAYFGSLWDSINAKRAPWGSNPWVWAISFRKIEDC